MNNLYILITNFLQEYSTSYLDLFSILSVFCAIFIIINKNPIVSILFLICLFVLVAGYLIFIGMKFIGISYLLVYIGAVSILFLFILMLINIRISEIQTETSNSLPLAIIISLYFYIPFFEITPVSDNNINMKDIGYDLIETNPIHYNEYLTNVNYIVSNQ